MNTILLRPDTWDLVLDSSGNIAMATGAYALAQDVASACRLFQGELWYNTAAGQPYFTQVLNQPLNIPLFANLLQQAALTVPGVVTATAYITSLVNRKASGQIQFTDSTGGTQTVIL